MKRNSNKKLDKLSLVGPGKFSKHMGVTTKLDAIKLEQKDKDSIWIEDWGLHQKLEKYIETTKRIGIEYAEEDADLPFRFNLSHKSDKVLSILEKTRKPIDY